MHPCSWRLKELMVETIAAGTMAGSSFMWNTGGDYHGGGTHSCEDYGSSFIVVESMVVSIIVVVHMAVRSMVAGS